MNVVAQRKAVASEVVRLVRAIQNQAVSFSRLFFVQIAINARHIANAF